jgi:hypothetical protein
VKTTLPCTCCLQVAAQEPASILSLLQQLTHPSVPNFCIINCEAWQPLLLLLPQLLTSSSADTAAAAQKLLLQQLAPELLDCNPEPLAQLLLVLLAAATCSHLPAAATAAGTDTVAGPASASAAAGNSFTWPSGVVQLLVVGLTKLSRQWHFLEAELAVQLCSALVDVLLQPLIHPLQPRHQQQQQQQGQQPEVVRPQPQQQQQQGIGEPTHVACCLAEQMLLADPALGWWHRLSANAKSCRGLRQVAVQKGLVQVLLQRMPRMTQQASEQQQQQQQQPGGEDAMNEQVAAMQAAAAASVSALDAHPASSSSSIEHSGRLVNCLVVQLLSSFVTNPAGRQVLLQEAAAAQQSSCAGHDGSRAQLTDRQQQQQQAAVSCKEPAVGWDVLAAAGSCLNRMADACTAASTGCDDLVAAAAAAEAQRASAVLKGCAGA